MTSFLFTFTTITFLVLLSKSVEQLCDTYDIQYFCTQFHCITSYCPTFNLAFESKKMTNPNALWEDMSTLDSLYSELCWDPDDELMFTHENGRVLIINKTLENKSKE